MFDCEYCEFLTQIIERDSPNEGDISVIPICTCENECPYIYPGDK